MKGGSKASDLVMATNPKLCDGKVSPVITGPKIQGNVSDFKLYRTTGGGKNIKRKKSSNKRSVKSNKRKSNKRSVKSNKRNSNKRSVNSNKKSVNSNKRSVNSNKKSVNSNKRYTKGNNKVNNKGKKNMKGGSLASDLVMRGEHPGEVKYCPQTNKVGGGKNRRNSKRRLRKQKGSGSDWKMTLYSRGPVNTPNQNPDEFRMFTQTAEFIPNETLRAGKFTK